MTSVRARTALGQLCDVSGKWRDFVWEVDTQVAAQDGFVFLFCSHNDAVDVPAIAATDGHRLRSCGSQQVGVEKVGDDQIAVAVVVADVSVTTKARGPRSGGERPGAQHSWFLLGCSVVYMIHRQPCVVANSRAAGSATSRRPCQFLLALFTSGSLPSDEAHTVLPPPLSTVVDHLRREWSEMPLRPIRVDELASIARVSRSYLSRLFQAEFGISVGSCTEGLRLSRAESLVARTDMTISSIARHCGFADLYHFSHRFTRRYGVSPSVYGNEGVSSPSVLDHPGMRRLAHALWE